MVKLYRTLILLVVLSQTAGCFLFREAPYPRPHGVKVPAAVQSQVLNNLARDAALGPGEQQVVLAKIRIRSAEERSRFRLLMTLQPQTVKLELLPEQLAAPFAVLYQRGDAAVAVSHTEKVIVKAKKGTELLQRLISVPLDPYELSFLLLGSVPQELVSQYRGQVYETDDTFEIAHNDHLRYWQVSKDDGTIKYAEYRATKKASQLVKVWREDETLRVVIPEEDSEITIVVSAQKRVPLAAIELALPEYFRKIEL